VAASGRAGDVGWAARQDDIRNLQRLSSRCYAYCESVFTEATFPIHALSSEVRFQFVKGHLLAIATHLAAINRVVAVEKWRQGQGLESLSLFGFENSLFIHIQALPRGYDGGITIMVHLRGIVCKPNTQQRKRTYSLHPSHQEPTMLVVTIQAF
jgi:hypothetical protein